MVSNHLRVRKQYGVGNFSFFFFALIIPGEFLDSFSLFYKYLIRPKMPG